MTAGEWEGERRLFRETRCSGNRDTRCGDNWDRDGLGGGGMQGSAICSSACASPSLDREVRHIRDG